MIGENMIYSREEYILWNLIYSNAQKEKISYLSVLVLFKISILSNMNVFIDENYLKLCKDLKLLEFFETKGYEKYGKTIQKILNKCKKNNIELLFYEYENYPEELRVIKDSPIMLYCIGKFPNEKERKNSVAVVGSRNMSIYGEKLVKKGYCVKNKFEEERK